MSVNRKASDLSPAQRRVLIWSLVALASCLAMNAYHYSLQGARGLYLWNRTGMFRSLILMGFIPISIALLSFPLGKLANKRAAAVFRGAALVLSFLVTLASAGILALLV